MQESKEQFVAARRISGGDANNVEIVPTTVEQNVDRFETWRRLGRDPVGVAAAAVVAVAVLLAVAGGPIAARATGHPPDQQFTNALNSSGLPIGFLGRTYDAAGRTNPKGELFVLGADRLGQDQLVRVLYGLRLSLLIAVSAALMSMVLGLLIGMSAGYFGGGLDVVVSRVIETSMAFPALLLGIGLALALGPGVASVIIVLTAFGWYYPARLFRGATRSLRSREYVEAAVASGATSRRILHRHITPQLVGPACIVFSSAIANNILFEAALSYLGLGVTPPTPTWGQMLSDAVQSNLYLVRPALAIVPAVALVLLVLAFNLLSDSLSDALDGSRRR